MIDVLVVEDSAFMRKVISEILEADPEIKVVDNAINGLEGVKKASLLKPDVITMDIEMPNMDGISFLKEKSTRDNIKDIPVLMISTETGEDIIGEAKSYGAIGAIKKPFTPDKVNEVLGPLL